MKKLLLCLFFFIILISKSESKIKQYLLETEDGKENKAKRGASKEVHLSLSRFCGDYMSGNANTDYMSGNANTDYMSDNANADYMSDDESADFVLGGLFRSLGNTMFKSALDDPNLLKV